jgi:hypothetical protein
MMIVSIVIGALGFVSGLSALLYSVRVAGQFDTFNQNIKSWSEAIDDSAALAIDRAARRMLRELDEKIGENKNEIEKN